MQTTASPAVVSPGLCSSETQERDELVQPIAADIGACPGSAQIPLPHASAIHCPSSPVKRRLHTSLHARGTQYCSKDHRDPWHRVWPRETSRGAQPCSACSV